MRMKLTCAPFDLLPPESLVDDPADPHDDSQKDEVAVEDRGPLDARRLRRHGRLEHLERRSERLETRRLRSFPGKDVGGVHPALGYHVIEERHLLAFRRADLHHQPVGPLERDLGRLVVNVPDGPARLFQRLPKAFDVPVHESAFGIGDRHVGRRDEKQRRPVGRLHGERPPVGIFDLLPFPALPRSLDREAIGLIGQGPALDHGRGDGRLAGLALGESRRRKDEQEKEAHPGRGSHCNLQSKFVMDPATQEAACATLRVCQRMYTPTCTPRMAAPILRARFGSRR